MSLDDLAMFVATVTEASLPSPPDFIDFESVDLYMSTGETIATKNYPAGFSFDAHMIVFGSRMDVDASLAGGILSVAADVDDLKIGPLAIKGTNGKKATLDLHIGAGIQQLHVDGAIDFLGVHTSLLLNLEIQPSPTFSFDFILNFTNVLHFAVDAKMVGTVDDLKDLSKLDFELTAVFEQHLLDYVRDQIIAKLEEAKQASVHALVDAQEAVTKAEKEYNDQCNEAQAKLDIKHALWQQHSDAVHAESKATIDQYNLKAQDLQTTVHKEQEKYNIALKDAEGVLSTLR